MSVRPWYRDLRCRHCGRPVLVGPKSEAASFHRPAVDEPWAAHARCREEGMSTREIGDVLGVDHKTVVNDHHATGENSPLYAEEATPDSERDPVTGENSPPATENEPTPAEKDRARKERGAEKRESKRAEVRHVLAELAGTVDAVVTDPPYQQEWIDRDVATGWKPVLVYTRPDAPEPDFLRDDVFVSDSADKAHHHWGQSTSGTRRLVEAFTRPGDLVVDPFLGGGTTAVVCRELGRRFVGCDVDEHAVSATSARLQEQAA